MTQIPGQPPTQHIPGPPVAARPHRGAMILVFGILSWFLCIIFGIVAWTMGNSDLREMDAGRMDPMGRGLTQAGRVIGMVHVLLFIGFIALYLVILAVLAIGAAFAGTSGSP